MRYLGEGLAKCVGGIFQLTVAFFVLKVLDYLDWAWFWVFSPLWITAGIVLCILIGVVAGMLLGWWLQEPWKVGGKNEDMET